MAADDPTPACLPNSTGSCTYELNSGPKNPEDPLIHRRPINADEEYDRCVSERCGPFLVDNDIEGYNNCMDQCLEEFYERKRKGGSGNGNGNDDTDDDGYWHGTPEMDCKSQSRCYKDCWDTSEFDTAGVAACSHCTRTPCAAKVDENCYWCMPNALQFCLACELWSNWNPCICAFADCAVECMISESGLGNILGISDKCKEFLRRQSESGDCPLDKKQAGSGGDKPPGSPAPIGVDDIECIDEIREKLEDLLKKAQEWADGGKGRMKGYGRCIGCCSANLLSCTAVALRGYCILDPLIHGYKADYWEGCKLHTP